MRVLQTHVKTGPIMGNKKVPALTLSFLLMASLCLDAFVIYKTIRSSSKKMSWTEARLYCQRVHVDMATLDMMSTRVSEWLVTNELSQVWIGLVRDPNNDSVWKRINLKTGEGISGDDVSKSIRWATEEQSRECAVVSDGDLTGEQCSREYQFYCSVKDRIQYHDIAFNWYDASLYCKQNSGDLALITETNKDKFNEEGWTGMYREAGETWTWIGDLPPDDRNLSSDKTLNCATYNPATEECHSHPCSSQFPPICYTDKLVVVNESKTWEDALKHCLDMDTPCVQSDRPCKYRHDLLSLTYLSDYSYVRDRIYRATTDEVWTGLRFLGGAWHWVTGQTLKDEGMLPNCPSQRKHCGTLSKYDTNNWIIRDCSEKRNFICYRTKILFALADDTETETEEPKKNGHA